MRERLSQLLYPVYQPIMNASSYPVYWEATLRTYATRGPGNDTHRRLLSVAEEAGFIDELDCTMAQIVLEAMKRSGVAVGVNVSAFTVQNATDAFLQIIRRRAGDTPLVVEITETLQPDRMDLMDRFVAEVRRTGAEIAIDDYGIGHFERRDVEIIRPGYLKLALERVVQLDRSEGREWVREAADLGASVGAMVVAEGVEDDSVVSLLHSLGVQMFQGYLWGRPTHIVPRPRAPAANQAFHSTARGYVAVPVG